MDVLGRTITGFFDLLLLPLGRGHHTAELVYLSLLTGIVMAFVFKWTSNPTAIRKAKDRRNARFLEMRVYQDDPLLILKAFGGTLRTNLSYLRSLARPFFILLLPLVVVFMQLDERYARRHLEEGAHPVVTVRLKPGQDPFETTATIQAPPGVRQDSKAVRIADTREVSWRIRVAESGMHALTLTAGDMAYTLPVVADPKYRMIGHDRRASSLLEPLLHPALPAFPEGSPVERVRLGYPEARYPLLTWNVHWIVIFIVYSLVAAIVLKFIIKFEI